MTELTTPCLVIGTGIAGLSTAIALAEAGVECAVLTSAPTLTESNSWYAQGGIVYQAAEAGEESLVGDILEAGGGANFLPAVRQLAQKGPPLVKRLLLDGARVPFKRKDDGNLALTREAAHHESRILYSGDQTGKSVEESLAQYARSFPGIRFLTGVTAVNLLMTSFHDRDRSRRHEPARCFGAFVFDQTASEVRPIFAQHTVLATGGIGQLFLHSTNSSVARGDGIALAHRAGARLSQLEFVQFHPTTFYHEKARRFLISEALRGEGAVLLNQAGERFLQKYLPGRSDPELAARDRVAWAINQELLSSGATSVFLDISFKPADWIRERFPFVYQSCLEHGVDITRQPIPVVPGAHYHVGGVWTDLSGRTSVPRLWAAGEVGSTGLHGYNRLASTSLLEGLVWGTAAGESIGRELQVEGPREVPAIEPWKPETEPMDASFLQQDWITLKHTMWNYVGLMKSDLRLRRAEGILRELNHGIEFFYRRAVLSDALIGLRNASLVALLLVEACQRNPRSQGCYLREEAEAWAEA